MDKMMRTQEAAEFLRLNPRILEIWRCKGGGPKFYKVGRKIIMYYLEDLEKFAQDKEVTDDSSPQNHCGA